MLYVVDDGGLTPLHYLISCGGKLGFQQLGPLVTRLGASLVSPRTARMASNEGILPLHTALEHGVGLMDELCAAAPETDPFFVSVPDGMQRDHITVQSREIVHTASNGSPTCCNNEQCPYMRKVVENSKYGRKYIIYHNISYEREEEEYSQATLFGISCCSVLGSAADLSSLVAILCL